MCLLSESIENFLLNKNKYFVTIRLLLCTISCIRVLLIRLNINYDYNCYIRKKCQEYSLILHHHYNQWNGYYDKNSFFIGAFFFYISFTVIRLFLCYIISLDDKMTHKIIEPIRFCEKVSKKNYIYNENTIKRIPNIELTKKFFIYMPLGYLLLAGLMDFLLYYSYVEFKLTTWFSIKEIYVTFFVLLDSYYIIKIPTCYFIVIRFLCAMFNLKLELLNNMTGSFEEKLKNTVDMLTQIRKYNNAFHLFIGTLIFTTEVQLAQLIYVSIEYRRSAFTILYHFNLLALGSYLYYCIHLLSLVNIRFMKIIRKLEATYKIESVNYSVEKKFKFNYILNNCKFRNSFSFFNIEDISNDFFRKVTFWVLINTIRLETNNMK